MPRFMRASTLVPLLGFAMTLPKITFPLVVSRPTVAPELNPLAVVVARPRSVIMFASVNSPVPPMLNAMVPPPPTLMFVLLHAAAAPLL